MIPSLSIVIPSHCRVDLLELCLRSVQPFRPKGYEVIVVDDGSRDGIVAETARRFENVIVIKRPRSNGFAAAANAGIAAATGQFVELLNDDTEVTPNWAETALGRFDDPTVVAVAPLVLMHPDTSCSKHPLVDSAGDGYDRGGFAYKRGHGQRLTASHVALGPCESVSAAAGFYRRDALLRVGGFEESFGAYFEDVDLSLRLRRAGGRLEFEPNSVVWHRVSASYSRSPSRRTLERQSCNEERLYWRHANTRRFLHDFSRHVAVLSAKVARRQTEKQISPWLTGRIRTVWNALKIGTYC